MKHNPLQAENSKKNLISHTFKWTLSNHQVVLPKGENGYSRLAESPQDGLKACPSMHLPFNNYLCNASMRQAVKTYAQVPATSELSECQWSITKYLLFVHCVITWHCPRHWRYKDNSDTNLGPNGAYNVEEEADK